MRNICLAAAISMAMVFLSACGSGNGGKTPNNAPQFTLLPAPEAFENTFYGYNATVHDPEGVTSPITCTISSADTCGGHLAGCYYTFTPDETQGGTTCVIGMIATDSGNPPMSAVLTYTINIIEVNDPPVITSTAPSNATEGTPYSYNITTTDNDSDPITLSLSPGDTCGGVVTDNGNGTGTYDFIPSEAQSGPGCTVGVRASDPNVGTDQDTLINIPELNQAPAFDSAAPAAATEGVLYTYAAAVSDVDVPAQVLTCSINASDTCGGVLAGCTYTFTPSEAQSGPGCTVGIRVTDNGTPVLFADQNTPLNIPELNQAPTITSIASTGATENVLYSYAVTATDPDIPQQTLTCTKNASDTCAGAMVGCDYSFTPDETEGGTICTVGIRVTDNGSPALYADQNTAVNIAEDNQQPYFTTLAPTTGTEAVTYTYSAGVDDFDIPAQTLTCSINGSDTCGGTLTGCSYSFLVSEAQSGTSCVVGLTVTDNGTPPLSADQNTTVNIPELNQAPSFTTSAPTTATEGSPYSYAAGVSDPDIPAQTLACSVNGSDTCGGALVGCAYSFTPSETQGGASCVVAITVADNGSPVLSTDQNTVVNVSEVNNAPAWNPSPSNIQVYPGDIYNAANGHANDSDSPGTLIGDPGYVYCESVGDTCSFAVAVSGNGNGAVDCQISFTAGSSPESCSVSVQVQDGWGSTISRTVPINVVVQCNDGIDNDGDTLTDYPADLGCTAALDDDETTVWYVDVMAAGAGTGRSWTDAFTHPQNAANDTRVRNNHQVWVADGTYGPTGSWAPALTMKAGVKFYGGFAGNESSIGARSGGASVLYGGSPLYSYHTVLGASNALLDKFTVRDGYAAMPTGEERHGAGIYNTANNLTVTNCLITSNTSAGKGAGFYNTGTNLVVDNCTISSNRIFCGDCNGRGAGMYTMGQVVTITNSVFANNDAKTAYVFVGGLLVDSYGGNMNTNVTVKNCLFVGNSGQTAGGLAMWAYCSTAGTYTIENCTFSGNNVSTTASAVEVGTGGCSTITSKIIDSVIWGNTTGVAGNPPINVASGSLTVQYTDVEGGWGGTGNINSNPLFVSGYRLSQTASGQASNSPCVNAGSETAVNLGLNTRTTRTDNVADGGIVDMGYHYPIP